MDENKRKALRLELRGIISTDRQAAQIMAEAHAQRQALEEATRKQKHAILEEAAKRRELAEKQAVAEAQAELDKRRKTAKFQFEDDKRRLAAQMQQNRDAWADEMLARVLGKAEG